MNIKLCKHGQTQFGGCTECAYERGKADGIREGMERAEVICNDAYKRNKVHADSQTGIVGFGVTAAFAAAYKEAAQAIRSAKEKL